MSAMFFNLTGGADGLEGNASIVFGKRWSMIVSCLAMMASTATSFACETPKAIEYHGQVITSGRATVTWAPLIAATEYVLRVNSRVPNGQVVTTSHSVLTLPAYVPPQPLVDHRAKVTFRVQAVCGKVSSAETMSWFLVDTSADCRLGYIDAETEVGGVKLKWRPVRGGRSYEVRAYRLEDARQIDALEVRGTEARMSLAEPAILSVRPSCMSGWGEAVYRVVAR